MQLCREQGFGGLVRRVCHEAWACCPTLCPQFPPVRSVVCEALTCLRFRFLRHHPGGPLLADTIHDPGGHLGALACPWHSGGLALVSSWAVIHRTPKGPEQEAGVGPARGLLACLGEGPPKGTQAQPRSLTVGAGCVPTACPPSALHWGLGLHRLLGAVQLWPRAPFPR